MILLSTPIFILNTQVWVWRQRWVPHPIRQPGHCASRSPVPGCGQRAGRTGVPPGPSPGTVTNAEQTALGVPKPGQGRAWKCTFCGNFRGSLPDCVAGLPGPFHPERGMSLGSCSFHTSGPRVLVPVHPLSPPCPPWTPSVCDFREQPWTSGLLLKDPQLIILICRIPAGASLPGLVEM